ncbi:class I SAM-dependent methyltransferase [Snuella lapsa]|uniref:Methyltransferase domain-containing protein n=1 Tax=Snuella lapsa TaxID=870481 RepID=A0ABP6YJJ4_9FLAO
MKAIIKADTIDKYLRSIRFQIVELIDPNTTLIELGCGNGDLLFKLAGKLKLGVGIDKSEQLITYASNRVKKEQVKNLEFRLMDLLKDSYSEPNMDYSVASLLLHILPLEKSIELIKKLLASSNTTIICGFCEPKNIRQKMLLWLDQRFTSHYSNFRDYKRNGFTEGLLNSIEKIKYDRIDTFDPVIKIYKITKSNKDV